MMRRIASETRAVSAVEFALCLPFLVTLYLGGYQLSDAISAYRKVTTATRAVADLTSQYTNMSDSELQTVLLASQQVMSPYNLNNAKLTVSQIKIDGSGNATVAWSAGKNVTALTTGASFNVPASIRQPNTYLIVAGVDYLYVPSLASSLLGSFNMREQVILSPRAVACIKRNGNCDA